MALHPHPNGWTTVNGQTLRHANDSELPPDSSRDANRQTARRIHVRRAKVWLLGERDYPERLVKIPEHLVRDLPDLLAAAQQLNPATSADAVVKTIWRLGSYRLEQNLIRRIPIRLAELP